MRNKNPAIEPPRLRSIRPFVHSFTVYLSSPCQKALTTLPFQHFPRTANIPHILTTLPLHLPLDHIPTQIPDCRLHIPRRV